MSKVVISEPLRTAIGTFGGALQDVSAVNLGCLLYTSDAADE